MLLFFQPEILNPELANKVLKVTPATMTGYGLALLACIVMAVVFYRQLNDEKKYSRERDQKVLEFNQKSLEVMIKVEMRLQDQQNIPDKFANLDTRFHEIALNLQDLASKNEELVNLIRQKYP